MPAKKAPLKLSTSQFIFLAYCQQELGLEPVPEYKFYPTRNWKADYFFCLPGGWPAVALEVEGGVHEGNNRGRHLRAGGFLGDMEKYNAAASLGIILLRVTPAQLNTLATVNQVRQALLAQFWLAARRCGKAKEGAWVDCPQCGSRYVFKPGDKWELPQAMRYTAHVKECNGMVKYRLPGKMQEETVKDRKKRTTQAHALPAALVHLGETPAQALESLRHHIEHLGLEEVCAATLQAIDKKLAKLQPGRFEPGGIMAPGALDVEGGEFIIPTTTVDGTLRMLLKRSRSQKKKNP